MRLPGYWHQKTTLIRLPWKLILAALWCLEFDLLLWLVVALWSDFQIINQVNVIVVISEIQLNIILYFLFRANGCKRRNESTLQLCLMAWRFQIIFTIFDLQFWYLYVQGDLISHICKVGLLRLKMAYALFSKFFLILIGVKILSALATHLRAHCNGCQFLRGSILTETGRCFSFWYYDMIQLLYIAARSIRLISNLQTTVIGMP